jgi:hypothetical protein
MALSLVWPINLSTINFVVEVLLLLIKLLAKELYQLVPEAIFIVSTVTSQR